MKEWCKQMTPEKLLHECETLTHNGRMRRMVELGRLASNDTSISQTLAALAQGDVYQRTLVTQACYGSRDSAQTLRALSDPSRSVRGLALGLTALTCSDAELQQALESLPLDLKMALARVLSRRRRQSPIDLSLETLASHDHASFMMLLPFGSRAFVSRSFGQVSEGIDLVSLCRFARHHPDLVIEYLRTRATASETLDPQLVHQVNAVLPHLTDRVPDLALDLVKTLVTVIPPARLQLQVLARKRPNEVADLLLSINEHSSVRFDTVAHRLSTERLLALFLRYPGTISTRPFDRLRPEQRLALYTACERGWRNTDGVLVYHVVAALPTAQRIQEGRRHLALPALATRPLDQFPYAAFLPWDEARALLDTPLRSPDANLRGAAIKALITATRYQRKHLADALQLVRSRRNEQDPVRREMLTALAALPHGIWQAEHLEDLAQILRDALNATDLSHPTAQAMERLVVHLFPFHPEWSANQMATVYRERGHISVFRLDAYLSDADIQRIAPVLTPILHSWQRRENERLLVALATALGKRLRAFDELADVLETAVEQTLSPGIADSILRLFLEHHRARVYLLIPRILRRDKSAITLSSVSSYLHRHRQDLLTPFLGQHAYKGRFSTGRTRFVLPVYDGFQCWTPTQQQVFTRTLLEVVQQKDQNRATYELLSTIRRLAAMIAIDFAPLMQFASDERPPVREAALRALGRLDAGQGIPTLLESLNDERARIAIYALRKALLSMPKAEALTLLCNAPLSQVTVAKEIVRLIGELSSEDAYRALLALETRELHRDVRVALLRALWDYAEHPETWEIFTRAAQGPDIALARGVVHIPADGMSPVAQRRLATLIATLLAHPEPEVRMATLQWRSQHPLTDHDRVLLAQLLALLNSPLPDECALAAKAIFAIYTGTDAVLVGEAVRPLLSNRRALHIACTTYSSILPSNRGHLLPTTRALLATLAEDPLTLTFQIELILKGLPWEEIAPELVKRVDDLHPDALERAKLIIQRDPARPDAQLFDLEATLAKSENERLRRLALAALVAQSKQLGGWSDDCIARLQQYREDPSPLVAEAAQFTFVS